MNLPIAQPLKTAKKSIKVNFTLQKIISFIVNTVISSLIFIVMYYNNRMTYLAMNPVRHLSFIVLFSTIADSTALFVGVLIMHTLFYLFKLARPSMAKIAQPYRKSEVLGNTISIMLNALLTLGCFTAFLRSIAVNFWIFLGIYLATKIVVYLLKSWLTSKILKKIMLILTILIGYLVILSIALVELIGVF
jgi:hypothetical protein